MGFVGRFVEALDAIESEAEAVGMSKRKLAEVAGCSPATFGRWRKKPPATIEAVAKMERAIAAKRGV